MVSQRVVIKNPTGLHARPASQFVEVAKTFICDVSIQKINQKSSMNGKSMIHILTGKLISGTEVIISCNGKDEEDALITLVNFITDLSD